ncbi:hypothetical protein [Glycomyces buryatensis]|uniref:Uncharacterized protein n=1 Tax=Glycomyces buryatensis TaxID=2570927 RepID=A0A4S8QHI3_9ACTN|nr:hypothetical protein [Glycomyces buryatensis]THV42415.1 hypothetical protein FAB82_07110 [Glycomyces buryatensis]
MMTHLHLTGIACVDGRYLRYTSLPYQARLRITFCGNPPWEPEADTGQPGALGSVTGLDTDGPDLRISAPLHAEWANNNREAIVAEAARIWQRGTRFCDG